MWNLAKTSMSVVALLCTGHFHSFAQQTSSNSTQKSNELTTSSPSVSAVRSMPRVVGGRLTTIEEWPFIVSIRGEHPITGDPATFCGGTAITEEWILTAAHCVVSSDYSEWPSLGIHTWPAKDESGLWTHNIWGELSIVANTDDLASEKKSAVLEIEDIVVHAEYQPIESASSSFNDLALIKLKNANLTYSANLSFSAETDPTPEKSRAYVAGFGSTLASLAGLTSFTFIPSGEEGWAGSRFLQQAIVPVVSKEACEQVYKDHNSKLHLCAGHSNGGEDSCQGDSGGPLVGRSATDQPVVVGVVSFGRECGESLAAGGGYGVYERVSSRIEWMQSHVENLKVKNFAPETTRQAVVGLANDFERQLSDIKNNFNIELAELTLGGEAGKVVVTAGESKNLTVSSKIEGYVLVFEPPGNSSPASLIYPYFASDIKTIGPDASLEIPLFAMLNEPGVPEQSYLIALVIPEDLYTQLQEKTLIPKGRGDSTKTYNEFYDFLSLTLAYVLDSSEPGGRLEHVAFSTLDYLIVP